VDIVVYRSRAEMANTARRVCTRGGEKCERAPNPEPVDFTLQIR
jgi:hypothetical protein